MNEAIPRLPIPPLEQTIRRYLERIRPLLDDTQYAGAEQVALRFLSGGGKRLHRKLEEWSKDICGSWLKPLWDDSYLCSRGALNGNVNYAILLRPEALPRRGSFAEFCAGIIRALTGVYCRIAEGSLPQEFDRAAPLCMEQYKNVLKACRIPHPGRDELFVGEKSRGNAVIMVLRRENIYLMQVTDAEGNPYGIPQLAGSLEKIMSRADAPALSIGALTEAPRDEAANLRSRLCALDAGNADNFSRIANALFALCIDEIGSPRSADALGFDVLYGHGKNRYFDKCVQVIVGTDYTLGFNNEHSGFDGSCWMNVVQWVCDDLQNTGIQAQTSTAVSPPARQLEWVVNADVRDAIKKMQAESRKRGEQLHLRVIHFQEFGKTAIKGLKISPDAFFHLAVQLAWFRMHGRLASTYEAVAMRHFHQGRTECARPCTSPALAFVSACGDSRMGNAELAQLVRAAAEHHVKMLNDCQQAQGPERHLFGLQEMMKRTGEGLPKEEDLFSSAGYVALKHDTLSTSGLAAEHVDAFCFGPVVSDGFGIGYGICAENIRLAISCFEENKDRLDLFTEAVERALRDLRKILQYTE